MENKVIVLVPEVESQTSAKSCSIKTWSTSRKVLAGIAAAIIVSGIMGLVYFISRSQVSASADSSAASVPFNQSKAATVGDWKTCFDPAADTCASASYVCCISHDSGDIAQRKYTCRPNTGSQCSTVSSKSTGSLVDDWKTCTNPTSDVCKTSSYACVVAEADKAANKYTCRPSGSVAPKTASAVVGNWNTCSNPSSDKCASSGWSCVVAEADKAQNKYTCRPPAGPSSTPPAAYHPGSTYATSTGTMWVTAYQHDNGYTAGNWPNPGGCTSTTALLQSAFPTGDVKQWTGEMKNQAIRSIAERFNYNVISSAFAPDSCFKVVTLKAKSGAQAQAIVIDLSHVYHAENIGDVSQSVIDTLGGIPSSGHIDIASATYSNRLTFPKPAGFP